MGEKESISKLRCGERERVISKNRREERIING